MAATAAQLAKAATATTALMIKGPAFAEVYINLSTYIYIYTVIWGPPHPPLLLQE